MEREIRPEELSENVFDLIGNQWLLVAANDGEKTNAMTASWGSLGVMWGKPSAFLVIRPQRYTKEFLDRAQTFSLSILPGEKRELLNYMGTVSGRDEDKIRKQCAGPLVESSLLDPSVVEKWYPQKDFHILYIGRIEKVIVND